MKINDLKIDKKLNDNDMHNLALKIAKRAHAGQVDKNGTDYILHPLKVASLVETQTLKTIALLHDVCEDSEVSLNDLKYLGFSDEIIKAVDAITKRSSENYRTYLERVKTNKLAVRVKIADATHNSDATRIENPTQIDLVRSEKYAKSVDELKQLLDNA